MSPRKFLMLTSCLALAAVFYIFITKRETNVSKLMLEIFSRKEDIGFHSMEITPIKRQRVSNGELCREQGRIDLLLCHETRT